jgi:hypothetical protein
MTVREMQIAFDMQIQLIYQKLEIEEKPDSYTILYFLNRAQENYIKENFLSKGQIKDNIEYIQKRSDTLKNLISRYTETESTTALDATEVDGGIELSLPSDYLYYIKSFSYATNDLSSPSTKVWTPNRVVGHDEIDNITTGLFNTPILRKPCIVFEENDTAILYKDQDTAIYNYSFIYLRKPLELTIETAVEDETTIECELDEYTHQDIVELAVKMFIEDYKFKAAQPQN